MNQNESFRNIPSVEKIVNALGETPFGLPRPIVTSLVRRDLGKIRSKLARSQDLNPEISVDVIVSDCRATLAKFAASRIAPVINATGVLIHTNLGRSPLGPAVSRRLQKIASSYCNVEIDMVAGARGPRAGFLETALSALCQSEGATVVNNCAAALVLILKHLTCEDKNEVIVSRGELVEIGGGFRVPEILEASGATLREVGTTNRTRVSDYANAINPKTAMLLKVHRSNFSMDGFVESPASEQLAALSRKTNIPFVEDLGSGALLPTDHFAPIEHEPTPAEVIKTGVDLVCFSGDKLLGGPQAGIIAGRQDLVSGIKREPFYRAVRPDKLILAVLQETATEYLSFSAASGCPDVPVVQMLATPNEHLEKRADRILESFAPEVKAVCSVVPTMARCGGGTMPKSQIPSIAVEIALPGNQIEELAHSLRGGSPGIVGRIENGHFRLDMRTVFSHQDELLARHVESTVEKLLELQ